MFEHPTSRTTRSIRPDRPRRLQGDDGVSAFVAAVCMVTLLIFAALATDLGLAYAGGRAMQNGGDAAAMRGTAKLMEYKKTPSIGLASVQAATLTGVTDNGGVTMPLCQIIRNDATKSTIGNCGSGAENDAAAAGVRVSSHGTTPTAFGAVLGYSQVNETRTAAATAQPLAQGFGPFFVCGGGQVNDNSLAPNPPGSFNMHPADATHPSPWPYANGEVLPPPLEYNIGTTLAPNWVDMPKPTEANTLINKVDMAVLMATWPKERFRVNPEAIGAVYNVHTPQSNSSTFSDCANGSANWKGLGQGLGEPPLVLAQVVDPQNGAQAGPTRTNLASATVCNNSYIDCYLVLPLCPGSNGKTGTNYLMYCVMWGAFKMVGASNSGNAHAAQFLGFGTVAGGQGGLGNPDPNAAAVIKLVQ